MASQIFWVEISVNDHCSFHNQMQTLCYSFSKAIDDDGQSSSSEGSTVDFTEDRGKSDIDLEVEVKKEPKDCFTAGKNCPNATFNYYIVFCSLYG